jgi:S1-C subfamily serine protease
VNAFDLLVLALAVSAGIGGYRLGLLARSLSWFGMALGLIAVSRFLPSLVGLFDGPDPNGRFLVAVGFLLGGAFLGQAIGLLVGSRLHLALPSSGRPLDRVLGAFTGVLGVMIGVWLLLPAVSDVPGSISRLSRNSTIARFIDDRAPEPPDTLQALRRLVGEGGFPQVFNALRPSPDIGPPPADSGLTPETADLVAASTMRIEGQACSRLQEGSGFVAEDGIVVTNAHVVAGEDRTELILTDGSRVSAEVVVFDPDRDLAVLSAPDLERAPLPLAESDETGTRGAVFGYPGGGSLELSPFEVRQDVEAVGRDLYDSRDTRREVLILAADLAPGDSGGALVDPTGSVAGVAFAIAPDRAGTAYALSLDELRAVLDAPRAPADTGPCLA